MKNRKGQEGEIGEAIVTVVLILIAVMIAFYFMFSFVGGVSKKASEAHIVSEESIRTTNAINTLLATEDGGMTYSQHIEACLVDSSLCTALQPKIDNWLTAIFEGNYSFYVEYKDGKYLESGKGRPKQIVFTDVAYLPTKEKELAEVRLITWQPTTE